MTTTNTNSSKMNNANKSVTEITVLSERLQKIQEFFESESNIRLIEENRRHSIKVSEYIKERILIKDDVLSQPFTI